MQERQMLEGFGGSPEPEYDYGLPGESVRGLSYQLHDLFTPYRYPIEREAGVKPTSDGGDFRMDPLSGQMIYETPAEVDPGQYGEGEFGLEYTPVVRGVKAGLGFFKDMVMDPEARQRAADVMRQAPAEIIRDMKLKTNAASMGSEYIQDPKTGEVLSTAEVPLMAPAITAVGTGASLLRSLPGEAPGKVLGVMGGRTAASGPDLQAEYQKLEESGLPSEEVYLEMQRRSMVQQDKPSFLGIPLKASSFDKIRNSFKGVFGGAVAKTYFPAYRDDEEGDIRFLIDQSDRSLIIKGKRPKNKTSENGLYQTETTQGRFDREAGFPQYERDKEPFDQYSDRLDKFNETPYTDKQIDQMTGLFEGGNGFLEIGLGRASGGPSNQYKKIFPEGTKYYGSKPSMDTVLEEIVDDPALFKQYPHLRSIRVRPTFPNSPERGSYNPTTKMIRMGKFEATDEGLQSFMSTLDHEMNHAIQHKEGVSMGANSELFKTTEHLQLAEYVKDGVESNTVALKQFTKAVVASFYKDQGASGQDAEADAENMLNEINKEPFKKDVPPNEKEVREVIQGVRSYIMSKSERRITDDYEAHRNQSYQEAVDSGQMLIGTYRTRKRLEDLVGRSVVDTIDRNGAGIVKKLSNHNLKREQLTRLNSAVFEQYLSNPGETNSRLSQLYTTGIKDQRFLTGNDISPKLALRFEEVLPDAVQIGRDNEGRFRSITFTRDVSGQELRNVGSPNALRELVAGDLPVDRSQIYDKNRIGVDTPFRSIDSPDESRKNYLTQRLAYVRGSLEQDNMMHPVTREKLAREYRSIMDELKSQTPPEQKAQGGPVGGLDVYFSKMQMQGT